MRAPRPILDVASSLGLASDEVEIWGRDKAKVSLTALERRQDRSGRLVLVTAISPTAAGEGKTVTTIGVGDAFHQLGRRTVVAIRQPSLGPVFGSKGGGAGGGRSHAHPAADLNLHFTGDFHAIAAAHNLMAALAEAHIHHGNAAGFAPHGLTWKRVVDLTDRGLREIVVGLGGKANGSPRETGFEITAASEVMALMALASSWGDLQARLDRVVLGTASDGRPITAGEIQASGAAAVLLRDALLPNLVQTGEGTPLVAHMGPFGNVATGCNSVIADRLALALGEVVVTEAGFGSDLGFEKFCHLVSPALGRGPDAVVMVATVRAVQAHAPKKLKPEASLEERLAALEAGAPILGAHLRIVRRLGLPVVVAINHFPGDTEEELRRLGALALELGANAAEVSQCFARGGEGAIPVARAVERLFAEARPALTSVVSEDQPVKQRIEAIATELYGAAGVSYAPAAEKKLAWLERWGFGRLPVCMAKTPYSLSHDPALLGAPRGFTLPITEIELAAGAGFVKVLTGDVLTMPGFRAKPSALAMRLEPDGTQTGLKV